jgi:hypothetical protein
MKLKYIFLIFICLQISCKDKSTLGKPAETEQTINIPETEQTINIPIFVIIGQSNAASRATYSEYTENYNLEVLSVNGEWIHSNPSLNEHSTIKHDEAYQGYNLGYSFAAEYADKIRIICNARGGKSILYFNDEGYKKTVERLEPYKEQIDGFLVHQGERDALNDNLFIWVDTAEEMIKKYRELLGWDVPFIFGQIGARGTRPGINTIMWELKDRLPNIDIVSSKGLSYEYSGHYNKESQIEFGKRYFNKYLEL